MIQQHPKFEEFINSFCGTDDLRNQLWKPIFYESGWVASTDSYSLLWTNLPEYKDKEGVYQYSKDEGPNAEAVLVDFFGMYTGQVQPVGKISIDFFENIFKEIETNPEYRDKYKECSECDGIGTIECDCCGNESECDECDGEGRVKCGKEETGYHIYPDNHAIDILGTTFSLNKIKELLDRLSLVEVKELEVFETNSLRFFSRIPNSNTYILIMGLYDSREEKETIYNTPIQSL